jgi:hypothetical protein
MKYRVIVNGVSFYTSAVAIKRGVGDFVSLNTAVRQLFEHMFNAVGISSRISVYDDKMEKVTYDIQITKLA